MKKYRLKEEVKKFIGVPYPEAINTLEYWDKYYVKLEALEEVPSRIELIISQIDGYGMYKTNKTYWTDQEKNLCEDVLTMLQQKGFDYTKKCLNGELLDIDSLDDKHFWNWYIDRMPKRQVICDLGIKAVLKQYLKEKK
jgi:hypothetical protein